MDKQLQLQQAPADVGCRRFRQLLHLAFRHEAWGLGAKIKMLGDREGRQD